MTRVMWFSLEIGINFFNCDIELQQNLINLGSNKTETEILEDKYLKIFIVES